MNEVSTDDSTSINSRRVWIRRILRGLALVLFVMLSIAGIKFYLIYSDIDAGWGKFYEALVEAEAAHPELADRQAWCEKHVAPVYGNDAFLEALGDYEFPEEHEDPSEYSFLELFAWGLYWDDLDYEKLASSTSNEEATAFLMETQPLANAFAAAAKKGRLFYEFEKNADGQWETNIADSMPGPLIYTQFMSARLLALSVIEGGVAAKQFDEESETFSKCLFEAPLMSMIGTLIHISVRDALLRNIEKTARHRHISERLVSFVEHNCGELPDTTLVLQSDIFDWTDLLKQMKNGDDYTSFDFSTSILMEWMHLDWLGQDPELKRAASALYEYSQAYEDQARFIRWASERVTQKQGHFEVEMPNVEEGLTYVYRGLEEANRSSYLCLLQLRILEREGALTKAKANEHTEKLSEDYWSVSWSGSSLTIKRMDSDDEWTFGLK